MKQKNLEQVFNDVHIVFTPDLFYGNTTKMERKDYIITSYGGPSKPMIWVCYYNKDLRELEKTLINSVSDYLKDDLNTKNYMKNDNMRYLCNQFIQSKEVYNEANKRI